MNRSLRRWLVIGVVVLFAISIIAPTVISLRQAAPELTTPPSSTPTVRASVDPAHVLPVPSQTYAVEDPPDRPVVEVPQVEPPGFTEPPPGAGLARYFEQEFSWADCGGFKCATFIAPLDWHDPDGQAITIAMRMAPATSEPYGGPLFINPGGPGGSAQEYVGGFNRAGLEQFDIIGLDSRGSGESTPVVCGTGPQTDQYYQADATPDDAAERQALIEAQEAFNEQCRANSGRLLDHISSIETIYDYDLARHLVGAERLNFYGISYGTFLGAVYAELYPERVGRMVLDSAVNLTPSDEVIQAQGFDVSMRAYADWCAEDPDCSLGQTSQQVIDTVVGFIDGLDAQPLPTQDSGRTLTQSLATTGLILHFYFGSEFYQYLTETLVYTIETGDGTYLLDAADALNERYDDGTYGSLTYAFPAIRCVDETDAGIDEAFDVWLGRDAEMAPIFGPMFGPDLVCPLWTATAAPQIDFTGAGAPPLLVVQNTGDSATPYRNAEIMADELESAVLVVRESAGHGAFDSGSMCIDQIVVDYFVSGTTPADGTRCAS
ncbi:MAG: alpha/beta hydrolase [Brooklawnia sp.]|jgi:pimeloyl-ACP methyl ester carboxylesterase